MKASEVREMSIADLRERIEIEKANLNGDGYYAVITKEYAPAKELGLPSSQIVLDQYSPISE